VVIPRHEQFAVLKQSFLVIDFTLFVLSNFVQRFCENLLDVKFVNDLLCLRKVFLHGRQALIDIVKANEYDENLSVRQTLFVDGFGSWGSDGPTDTGLMVSLLAAIK
jgi:hypothetical protein